MENLVNDDLDLSSSYESDNEVDNKTETGLIRPYFQGIYYH